MNYLLAILLVAATANLEQAPPKTFVKPIQIFSNQENITYDELYDEALFDCPFAKPNIEKQKIIKSLIEIEKSHNLPPPLRGMLLAAACHESGYNPGAEGDHKFSKNQKPMALGLFQMWPWWIRAYNIDRSDPEQSANAYLRHVKSKLEKIKYLCHHKSLKRTWLAAWATAIRSPKKTGRCDEQPKFYRILKRWHKNIKKNRQLDAECTDEGSCGC